MRPWRSSVSSTRRSHLILLADVAGLGAHPPGRAERRPSPASGSRRRPATTTDAPRRGQLERGRPPEPRAAAGHDRHLAIEQAVAKDLRAAMARRVCQMRDLPLHRRKIAHASVSRAMKAFASDNYAGAHPEVLAAVAGGQRRPRGRLRRRSVDRAGAGGPRAATSVAEAAVAARVQRLGRQRRLPAPGLPARGRRPRSAPPARTSTSTRAARRSSVGGIKLLAVPTPDGKLTPELVDRPARPAGRRARRPAARRHHHPEHRARHPLHGGGDRRARRHRARPRAAAARRRRAAGQRRRRPADAAERDHHRRRRRPAQPRRHQERDAARRGGGGARPGAGRGRPRTCASRRSSWPPRAASWRAQFVAMYGGDLWRRNAAHANAMADAPGRAPAAPIPGSPSPRPSRPTACSRSSRGRPPTRCGRDWPFYTWDEAPARRA